MLFERSGYKLVLQSRRQHLIKSTAAEGLEGGLLALSHFDLGKRFVKFVLYCGRTWVVYLKQKVDCILPSFWNDVFKRWLFDYRFSSLLDGCEDQNTSEQQKNNENFFVNRVTRDLSVADCRNWCGHEVPGCPIDSKCIINWQTCREDIVIFIKEAMFYDPALILAFFWIDVPYRNKAADKQMEAENKNKYCLQNLIEIVYEYLVLHESIF
jgi:hypothetical protein